MAHMHRAHIQIIYMLCKRRARRRGDDAAEQELVELIRKAISKNIERINLVADFFPVTHLAECRTTEQLVRDERYEKLSMCVCVRALSDGRIPGSVRLFRAQAVYVCRLL